MRKKIIAGSLSVSLLLGAGAALPEGVFDLGADIAVCAAVSGDFDHKVLSDGTAEYKDGSGNSVSGRWTVEEGKLCVRAAGGLEKFDYADDKLVDADNGLTYLHVDTLYVDR